MNDRGELFTLVLMYRRFTSAFHTFFPRISKVFDQDTAALVCL